MSKLTEEKEAVVAQFKKYAPQLYEYFVSKITLREHSANLYDFEVSETHLQRQELIKEVIREKVTELFGDGAVDELKLNLDSPLIANIADHHQVLNHPMLVSSNVIGNVGKLLQPEKPEAILTISSGDVPPNNFFSQNGFQFNKKKVPLFSNKERELTSYYIPKREFNFVERLKISKRWSEFDQAEQKFLETEQAKFNSFDFSRCQDYSDQITVAVKNTWPHIFTEDLRANLPELIYLTQEEIASKCLIKLLKEDNFISQCLLDKSFRDQVIKNFRGIVVTWNEKKQKGTHFFWRKYPGEDRSLRMYIDGNQLVPTDKRFKDQAVSLDKDTLVDLLKKKEIYPSLFLIFAVINYYSGVKPLVGFGSLVYLDLMKQVWLKTLAESDYQSEVESLKLVDTDGLVAGAAIYFKRLENGKLKTLFANDIYAEGGFGQEYLNKIFDMKFGDLVSFMVVANMYAYFSANYIPVKEHLKITIGFDEMAEEVFSWLK